PPTWLELNGERVAVQRSERPYFRIPATALGAGRNTARLVVDLGEAGTTATPAAMFTWEPPTTANGTPLPARHDGLLRITVNDTAAWVSGPRRFERNAPDGRLAAFMST